MSRRRNVTVLLLLLATSACSNSLVSDPPPSGTAPEAATVADTGCLDEAGTVRATPAAWYHDDALGFVGLNGDVPAAPSDRLAPLVLATTAAMAEQFGPMPEAGTREYTKAGCVTHRYVNFGLDNGTIVVTAWRVEHASQPGWIPNEGAFVAQGDDVLVSTGAHLVLALAVAPDGTTVRVAAYGIGELNAVSGWPTTMAQPLGAPPPGPAPATAEQVIAVARAALAQVVDR